MADEAMNCALEALASLQEKVDKSGDADVLNISHAIKKLQQDIESKKKEDNKYIEGAEGVVSVAQSVFDSFDKFTSGDPLEIAFGALSMVGTIGAVLAGPYGPLVEGVCSLVAGILNLFGGKKGPSLSEVVDKVIREALDDFKDEDIYEKVLGSLRVMTSQISQLNGVASHNGGKITDKESSFLTRNFGEAAGLTLGVLQGQIEKHIEIKNDEKKSKRIAQYVYYYCMLSVQKLVILNLQCSLLIVNEMEGLFAGIAHYLTKEMPSEDKRVLDFMSDLPEDPWYMLYRCLHTELNPAQRFIITAYRKNIGCTPMKGQLCVIASDYQKEYLYVSSKTHDRKRRYLFTWRPGDIDAQGLFRIIGERDHCQIYNVYFGEYIYAANYAAFDKSRRSVFSWRRRYPVNLGYWKISGSQIKSIFQNEYLFAADWYYSKKQRRVFTWREGGMVNKGDWTIKPLSYGRDYLTNHPNLK